MKFVIMHETVTSHDAIGNDIELMYKVINNKHECVVFACNRFNKNVSYIDDSELDNLLQRHDTIVIYHHSVYWKYGYEKVKSAKCQVIFRYHNITPEHFFEPYNEFAYHQCKLGREQTITMLEDYPDAFWLSDSMFNAEDLKSHSQDKIGICAPFNKIEEWSKKIPDETILRNLIESPQLNIMFVGRVAPNKGHLMLLDVIRTYCAYYDNNIKLRVIGKFDEGIQGYNELVMDKIRDYGLESVVEFIGEINDSTLMAYYLGSDVMLCCSEHEGFCVPVIEAQSFGLPIIALKECAVPETIGKNQLLFSNNCWEFAAALKKLKDDMAARRLIGEFGRQNYISRFTYNEIEKKFKIEIKRMTGVEV